MNRVPARPNKQSATDMEKRVGILTWLVVVQLVLLLVLLGFELAGGVGFPFRGTAETTTEDAELLADEDVGNNAAQDNTETTTGEPGEIAPIEAEPASPVRVEVLNGCGVRGLAGDYAAVLRNQGYDVRDTRNAPHHNYDSSWVIDRGTVPGAARRLAATLGIDTEHVTEEANPQLVDVDVSLILGKDYKTLNLQP